jgi:hypothetical protein
MTRGAVVVICLVALLAQSVPARASGHAGFGEVDRGRDGEFRRRIETPGGRGDEPATPIVAPSDGKVWVGIPALGSTVGDDGEIVYCRRTRWVRVETDDREQYVRDAHNGYLALFGGLPELEGHNPFLECPVEPGQQVEPADVRDAVVHTIRDDMPRPTLEVPPGYALTGMPAYLVTNHQLEYGPVTHTVDLGIDVLEVTVTATGVTEVDWGDGTTNTYDAPGTPWPDGQVVHTYRDTGRVTITVTDTWEVTYRVPALGIVDTVTAPLPARTLDDLEIQQVQAVRTSDSR